MSTNDLTPNFDMATLADSLDSDIRDSSDSRYIQSQNIVSWRARAGSKQVFRVRRYTGERAAKMIANANKNRDGIQVDDIFSVEYRTQWYSDARQEWRSSAKNLGFIAISWGNVPFQVNASGEPLVWQGNGGYDPSETDKLYSSVEYALKLAKRDGLVGTSENGQYSVFFRDIEPLDTSEAIFLASGTVETSENPFA